jgi:hypothetical protein
MDRALPYAGTVHTTQRSLPERLFLSPVAAFAIPLLVPLILLLV